MSDPISIAHLVAKARQGAQQQPADDLAARIEIVHFDDIRLSTSRRYLVKNIIPRVGLVVVWGPPKCGKSFWVYDLMMHISRGLDYHGRHVHQGAIVYCMFEGQGGADTRAVAYRQERLEEGGSAGAFYLQTVTLDLVRDHTALIEAIKKRLGNVTPAAVVLDTLNRSLVGSESSDEDMAAYLKAVSAIIETFQCAVIVVHHCGHNGDRPRGHSSLLGALDAEISVKRGDGQHSTAEVTRMKDGAEGGTVTFTLRQVVVGQDEDGEDMTSCVVEVTSTSAEPGTGKPGKALSDRQRLALEALDAALIDRGKSEYLADAPLGATHVHGDHWKAELFRRGVLDKGQKNPRADFKRLWEGLAARKLIAQRDGSFWKVAGVRD